MNYNKIDEHTEIGLYDNGDICIIQYDEELVNLSISGLANIPQVKALIEALESLEFRLWDGEYSYCPLCGCISPKHDNDCSIGNALAPFKMSTGDNEK